MKQIKCDRCGKVEAAEPMMKGYEFPIIKITRQDGIFDTINPREVDLCKDCRKQLADWLKPSCAVKEGIKKSLRMSEAFENLYYEALEKAADPKLMAKPPRQSNQPPRQSNQPIGQKTPDMGKEKLLSLLLLIFGGYGHGDQT